MPAPGDYSAWAADYAGYPDFGSPDNLRGTWGRFVDDNVFAQLSSAYVRLTGTLAQEGEISSLRSVLDTTGGEPDEVVHEEWVPVHP